jgi:hydroxyethylthiazole kinase-like sugar kinase family protein
MRRGDNIDRTTSSSRNASENVMLTAASVTATPVSRASCNDALQTRTFDILGNMAELSQLCSRGTTTEKDPKLEPKTLMLLMRCDEKKDVDGNW